MSLPAGQRRALGSIEARLRAADPDLASMFGIFARLNVGEPVAAEPLVSRRGLRRHRSRLAACAVVFIPVLFIATIVVSALAGGALSPRACVGHYALGGGSSPLVRPACQLSGDAAAAKAASVIAPATPDGTENPACIAMVRHARSVLGWVCYK